jgi:peptide N-acetyl-beta-D-glucosaminyl asparaginase amidase A
MRWTSCAPAATMLASLGILLNACSGHGSTEPALPSFSQANHNRVAKTAPANSRIRTSHALVGGTARRAQTFPVPGAYPVTADMPVSRPSETPCVVQLFSNVSFTDFTPRTYSYTPPANCPGPWAKVVLDGDFSVSAGRQFDRTASFWLGPTNLYFGTTAEPSATVSPSWHIERDVTDLSPIFTNASDGEAIIGNIVNSTYTGIIYASAELEFFPATSNNPAPVTPDAVYALSGGANGGVVSLHTPSDQLSGTFTFPRNVVRAYLDVFMEAQIGDEFWYTCFPNDLAQQLFNCGSTAFREGEVTVDGNPAGVAPVYPWIYTGGIDPWLWKPIPGVETLDFAPYRVDLTPFAGLLDDGNQHTVAVSVWNNGNYFDTTGVLLLYDDHGSSVVTGALVSDTTSASPMQSITEGVTTNKQGIASGPINTSSSHSVALDGYVNTSQGRVETKVLQNITFKNDQNITIDSVNFNTYDQSINQDTSVSSTVTQTFADGTQATYNQHKDWPLTLTYDFQLNADGTWGQTTSVAQAKNETSGFHPAASGKPFTTKLSNSVTSSNILTFAPDFSSYTPSNGKSQQQFSYNDSSGLCWNKTVTSANYTVTGTSGGSC